VGAVPWKTKPVIGDELRNLVRPPNRGGVKPKNRGGANNLNFVSTVAPDGAPPVVGRGDDDFEKNRRLWAGSYVCGGIF